MEAWWPERSFVGFLTLAKSTGHLSRLAGAAIDMGRSAPFFDERGQVCGNVMLTVPHFRFDPENHASHLQLLREAAAALTSRLGWTVV